MGQGVVTAVAAEIVKTGIKAAVAQWAPDLTKYVDPTAYGLAQIQAQLAEIDRKLTELIDHQQALEQHLNCVTQRVALDHVLSDAQASFATLRGAARISQPSERASVFSRLYAHYEAMVSDQNHLHRALEGSDGLIRACAKHIETGLRPYLNATLSDDVNAFYSTYQTAAAELLIVRANMIALHPQQFASTEAQDVATRLELWWSGERSIIKPHFPSTMTYDTKTGWLWRRITVPWSDQARRRMLEQAGWRITGYSTTPTCSAVESFVKQSGYTGTAALRQLDKLNVLSVPSGDTILCYDDHDRLHEFNLATYRYKYAGNETSHAPSVAAMPNNGQVDIGSYSYMG